MDSMFEGAVNFTGVGLDSWDVSSVKSTNYMFASAKMFDADLSTWDVGSVVSVEGMFFEASSFIGDGLGSWTIMNDTVLDGIFCNSSVNPFLASMGDSQ